MASAASLPEPQVLTHAKRRLFPDNGASDAYAVVDTQFATDEWLPGEPVPGAVRERLAPFNHVRLGSGYPDLVGVRALDADLLAVDRFGEANAAYVAAPAGAVSQSARTLARELNVGVLGVDADGAVTPLEVPRVVGNRTSADATAIRFQASAQGVADRSFSLNHPKNYLAYPLALYHPEDTDTVLANRVVAAVDGARTGAAFLGLVDERPDRVELTPLGEEVVRFALDRYGSVDAALDTFLAWKRSRTRFCELAPEWGLLTRRVVWQYPATQLLVEELGTMREDGITEPSLVDLVQWCHVQHPTFTVELFVRGTDGARERVLDEEGDLRPAALADGSVYHSPTVFQLKAIIYHAGVLTERGAEPSRLDPTADTWTLREPLDARRSRSDGAGPA